MLRLQSCLAAVTKASSFIIKLNTRFTIRCLTLTISQYCRLLTLKSFFVAIMGPLGGHWPRHVPGLQRKLRPLSTLEGSV
jgi:hypothetical protein